MGKVSVKENKNIYQLSRKELGWSREKAENEITNIENGKYGYLNKDCLYKI